MAAVARVRAPATPRFRFSIGGETMASIAVGAIVLCLVAVPLCVLGFSSLRDTTTKLPFEDTTFTLANYVSVFNSPATYKLLGTTATYAIGALLLGLGLGGLFAWFLTRVAVSMRTLLTMCVLAAMVTPPVVDAVAWSLLASPSIGILNTLIHSLTGTSGDGPLNIYSVAGMAFVTGIKSVPTAFIMLSGPIGRFDPSLEEAGLANGASAWATFRRVTLPLLRPATVGVLVLFAIFTLETFEVPAFLGLPSRIFVFSSLIYDQSHPAIGLPNYGVISAYAGIFLIVTGLLVVFYNRATAQTASFAIVTGKGYRPRSTNLGPFTALLVGLVLLYFLLAVVMPFFSLLWTSFGLSYKPTEFGSLAFANLNSFKAIFQAPNLARSAVNTVVITVVAATGTMSLASAVSWLSIRHRGVAEKIPDRLTMLTLAAPAIVVGVALIFFYAWLPLPIYGTVWIIVIGLSTRFLPYATRLMSAALLQIHKELEEAAALSGATISRTVRRVLLPLVWPSFSGGWLWVFVHALRDATLSLILFTVANDTLAVRLWTWWFSEGKPAEAAALGVCLSILTAGLSVGVIRTTMTQPSTT